MKSLIKKPHHSSKPQKSKCRLRVGDMVQVLSGAQKGARGEIESLDLIKNRVVVKNVNAKVKHKKPSTQDPEGGIRVIYAPLALSNVAYYDSEQKKPTRLGYRIENGEKKRFSKASNNTIEKKNPVREDDQ